MKSDLRSCVLLRRRDVLAYLGATDEMLKIWRDEGLLVPVKKKRVSARKHYLREDVVRFKKKLQGGE